jgi:hypothetical protein
MNVSADFLFRLAMTEKSLSFNLNHLIYLLCPVSFVKSFLE